MMKIWMGASRLLQCVSRTDPKPTYGGKAKCERKRQDKSKRIVVRENLKRDSGQGGGGEYRRREGFIKRISEGHYRRANKRKRLTKGGHQ